jgi:hypothetical protein
MEPAAAAQVAKNYVREVFADEGTDFALEEIEFDSERDAWLVTVGFSRPSDEATGFSLPPALRPRRRELKRVVVDDAHGKVSAVHIRE